MHQLVFEGHKSVSMQPGLSTKVTLLDMTSDWTGIHMIKDVAVTEQIEELYRFLYPSTEPVLNDNDWIIRRGKEELNTVKILHRISILKEDETLIVTNYCNDWLGYQIVKFQKLMRDKFGDKKVIFHTRRSELLATSLFDIDHIHVDGKPIRSLTDRDLRKSHNLRKMYEAGIFVQEEE